MHMSSSEAIQFCVDVGLPKSKECIVFKSTSMNEFDWKFKREDSFMFGDALTDGRVDDDDIFIPNHDLLFSLIN